MLAQRHDTLVTRPVKKLSQGHKRAQYLSNPAIKKAASRASSKARYISDPSRCESRAQYLSNPAIKKAASRASSKARYISDPSSKKAESRAQYLSNPSIKKAASRAGSKARYISDPASKKAESRAQYLSNPAIKKAASRAGSKARYLMNSVAKKSTSRRYCTCARKRDRYTLVEPDVKDTFVKEIEKCMLNNIKAKAQLIKAFKKQNKPDGKRVTGKVVCKIAAAQQSLANA